MRSLHRLSLLRVILDHSLHLALNHWQQYKRAPFITINPEIVQWLLDKGSLTKRLIEVSRGDFFVRKLSQSWQRPLLSEARLLNLKPNQVALIREVELVCHGEPWVYARSIFPLKTLSRKLRYLKNLGEQSLGTVLFNHPGMQRTLFEISKLFQQNLSALRNYHTKQSLWARRSQFAISGNPVLVTEVFLPPLALHASKVKL